MFTVVGIMIGFYILTRMFSFLTRRGQRAEPIAVKILSGVTIMVTILCLIDLIRRIAK
jgi:hypothetical protein